MSELRQLVEAGRLLRERSERFFIATVVDVHGSSYRRRGARMLFTEAEWLAGSVSGGCLERDVVAKGPWRTRDGRAQLVSYDGANDERSGSGCEGIIDVLVERVDHPTLTCPIRFAERCLVEERAGVSFTVFRSQDERVPVGARFARLSSGERESTVPPGGALHTLLESYAERVLQAPVLRAEVVQLAGCDVLLEVVVPPIHLFVFGSAHDALPVLTLAKAVGWSVTICDRHAQLSTRERFRAADAHLTGPITHAVAALDRCARPAAVIMAHHFERDLEALTALVASKAEYIGLLGSRIRSSRLLADLTDHGVVLDPKTRARIHTPVGLSIGAESPQEIALSIVAEVQACCAAAVVSSGATKVVVSREVELGARAESTLLASDA